MTRVRSQLKDEVYGEQGDPSSCALSGEKEDDSGRVMDRVRVVGA